MKDFERFSSPWAAEVTLTYNKVSEKLRFSRKNCPKIYQKENIAKDPEQFGWQIF